MSAFEGYADHQIASFPVVDAMLDVTVSEQPDRPPTMEITIETGRTVAQAFLTERQIERLLETLERAKETMRALEQRPTTAYVDLPGMLADFFDSEHVSKNLRFTTPDEVDVLLYVKRVEGWLQISNADAKPRGKGALTRIVDALEANFPEEFRGIEFAALTNERFKAWLVRRGYVEIRENVVCKEIHR